MDRSIMDIRLRLCIVLAGLAVVKGLEIKPSFEPTIGKFYHTGKDLTLSCSEKGLSYIDWMKDGVLVVQCSLDGIPYCLDPTGRYTYENGSFNQMLVNMKSKDCGQYTCRTNTESKSFDLHLIEYVKDIDFVEYNTYITMTTDCVYPANTVNVQWFYIHEDGSPLVYNKPDKRSEERGNCVDACWESRASKVLSTLEIPPVVKNPIQVKLMMYLEQGDVVLQKTSFKFYTIEGCLPPVKVGTITAICLASILFAVDIIYIALHAVTHIFADHAQVSSAPHEKHAKISDVHVCEENHTEQSHLSKMKVFEDVILAICVAVVIVIVCLILVSLKHETKIPDVNGKCLDVQVTNMFTVVGIAFVIIVVFVHWKIIWAFVKLTRNKVHKDKCVKTGEEHADERQTLTDGNGTVDTCLTNSYRQEEDPSNKTLALCPLSVNEVLINFGGKGKLTCRFDFNYPSWQAPSGKVINYGGKKEFEQEFQNHVSWDSDKKSIIVTVVKRSDAGKYVCFSFDGKVQTLDLFVLMPTEKIEVSEGEDVHMNPGNDIKRKRPMWRRFTNLVPELYNTVQNDKIELGRDDEKSVKIKQCQVGDSGFYEVVGNNIIKRFDVSVRKDKQADTIYTIDEDDTIRLESSCQAENPSWECVAADVFNYGGETNFNSIKLRTTIVEPSHFLWGVDGRSLVIKEIKTDDTGTYICRHPNGFVENTTVIVKGKPQVASGSRSNGTKMNTRISHFTGKKFPSMKYIFEDGKGEIYISHQNYEPSTSTFKPFKQDEENMGDIIENEKDHVEGSKVECSVYLKPVKSFIFPRENGH